MRKRVLLLGLVASVLGAAATSLWTHRESHVRRLLEHVLSRGLGVEARLGAASSARWTDRSLRLSDLILTHPSGARAIVGDVELALHPAGLLRGGDGAVRHVRAEGVELNISWRKPPRPRTARPAAARAPGRRSRLWARTRQLLDRSGVIELGGIRLALAQGTEFLILRDGTMTVERSEDDRLQIRGRARSGESGRIDWNGVMEPGGRTHGELRFHDASLESVAHLLPSLPWHELGRARVRGTIRIDASENGAVHYDAQLNLGRLGLSSPEIADRPLVFDLQLEGKGSWNGRRLEIAKARIERALARVDLSGAVERAGEGWMAELVASVPGTHCGVLMNAVPEALLGDFAGSEWQGHLGGSLEMSLDSRRPAEVELELRFSDRCVLEGSPKAADLDRFEETFLHRVRGAEGSVFAFETGPGSPNWTAISEISPFLVHAVLAHEDASFFRHGGIEPYAIEIAVRRNLEAGRFAYGASTITMQLAKNLFLKRDKSLARKVREAVLTWWLESRLSKTEILELYLNVIEYGPNVYGIRSAAAHYFGRRPLELSPAESAFLATLLPAPRSYHRQYERGAFTERTRSQLRSLLRHMAAKGRIDDHALAYGLGEVEGLAFHYGGTPRPRPRHFMGTAALLPFPIEQDRRNRLFDLRELAPER